jgi:hypothetical protein
VRWRFARAEGRNHPEVGPDDVIGWSQPGGLRERLLRAREVLSQQAIQPEETPGLGLAGDQRDRLRRVEVGIAAGDGAGGSGRKK